MRQQRDRDRLAHRGERRRLARLDAAAVARDRRDGAFLLGHDRRPGRLNRSATASSAARPSRVPIRCASTSESVKANFGSTLPAGTLEEDALAARHRSHDVAHRTGEVGRVDVHVVSGRDGVAAEADDRGDRRLVRPAHLQDGHLVVDELVGVPPENRAAVVAVRGPLAPVDRELHVGLAPDDPGGLEPLGGEPADGDDLVVEHAGERIDRTRRPPRRRHRRRRRSRPRREAPGACGSG